MRNAFYFGDNLHVLREYVADASVDLIYLDPPFNSNATYNLLFPSPDRKRWADAQIATFSDTWSWGDMAAAQFRELTRSASRAGDVMTALHRLLGPSDMLAYLVMMAARLVELRRVLKPTGSLYLHCDPTASHYLKVVLDGVFGADRFRAEIIWKRTNGRTTSKNWPHVHDVILHYADPAAKHAIPAVRGDPGKLPHTLITGNDGRKYQTYELTGPGITKSGETGKPWRGFDVAAMGRHWANGPAQMDAWADEGLIHFPKGGGFPRRRAPQPFDPASRAVTVGDVWTDIDRLNQTARERLGYPTQKPLALLERIIEASSKPGDVVLDPFCGCGTTLHAAQSLGRKWLGIDVAVQSLSVVTERLRRRFPNVAYDIFGIPTSVEGAHWLAEHDPFKFEEWVVSHVRAMHSGLYRNDGGIDGRFFYVRGRNDEDSGGIISVKAGRHLNPGMVRDLAGTLERERRLRADPYGIAVMLTAHRPTAGMLQEAREAGEVDTLFGPIPALQILSAEELFAGKRINVPAMHDLASAAGAARKRGPKASASSPEDRSREPEFLIPIPGGLSRDAHSAVMPARITRKTA